MKILFPPAPCLIPITNIYAVLLMFKEIILNALKPFIVRDKYVSLYETVSAFFTPRILDFGFWILDY
jgi:hypothetical protein